MLMCAISLSLHKTMIMTIHNRYLDIELVSPLYFYNRGKYYEYPIERTCTDAMMKVGFSFDPDQDKSGGILMYKLQRDERSDHLFNIDTKVIEEALKMMWLLITWKIERSREPKVKIMLVEYDNGFVMNEDKLAQLYDKTDVISSSHYKSKWLVCDDTALEITYEIVQKVGIELKIDISKGFRDQDTIKSKWIDSERQVLSEMAIYFY
jgi:hypothetical protein